MTEERNNRSRGKRPNAIKHGVFSTIAILPGEDFDQYMDLMALVLAEWSPIGPTEIDAVLTIVNCIWRKRRIQKFVCAKVEVRAIDIDPSGYDRDVWLDTFADAVALDPKFAERMVEACPDAYRKYFAKDYPAATLDLVEPAELAKKLIAHLEAERRERPPLPELPPNMRLMKSADILGEDLFKQELMMEERLDVMIDRAVKRLVQAKAVKQMLASPSLNGQDQKPKRIRIPKQAEGPPQAREH
jgi:hypothetical protein